MNDPVAGFADKIAEVDKKKERVLKAAAVATILNSEGGRALVSELNSLMETWDLSPEDMFATDPTTGLTDVNVGLVARCAGAREGLRAVLDWLSACQKTVELEAKKSMAVGDSV